MKTKIPTGLAVGIDVGDGCTAIRPLDLIALVFHQFDKLFFVDCVLHALVDLNGKCHLPTLTAHRSVILGLFDTRGLTFLRVADGQTMAQADLIRDFSELREVFLFKMQFLSVLETDRVDNEMRVDVIRIGMRRNDDLVVLPLLCQFQRNSVCLFRRDVFIRMEGLHEMKIHFSVALVVLQLCADELRIADFRLAVDTRDQLLSLILGFLLLLYVVQHNGQSRTVLSFGPIDRSDGCHSSHPPLQNVLELFLDFQIERVGFTDIDGADSAQVGQRGQLIQICSVLP